MRKQSPDQGASTGPGLGEPAGSAYRQYSNSSTLMVSVGIERRGWYGTCVNHSVFPSVYPCTLLIVGTQ